MENLTSKALYCETNWEHFQYVTSINSMLVRDYLMTSCAHIIRLRCVFFYINPELPLGQETVTRFQNHFGHEKQRTDTS